MFLHPERLHNIYYSFVFRFFIEILAPLFVFGAGACFEYSIEEKRHSFFKALSFICFFVDAFFTANSIYFSSLPQYSSKSLFSSYGMSLNAFLILVPSFEYLLFGLNVLSNPNIVHYVFYIANFIILSLFLLQFLKMPFNRPDINVILIIVVVFLLLFDILQIIFYVFSSISNTYFVCSLMFVIVISFFVGYFISIKILDSFAEVFIPSIFNQFSQQNQVFEAIPEDDKLQITLEENIPEIYKKPPLTSISILNKSKNPLAIMHYLTQNNKIELVLEKLFEIIDTTKNISLKLDCFKMLIITKNLNKEYADKLLAIPKSAVPFYLIQSLYDFQMEAKAEFYTCPTHNILSLEKDFMITQTALACIVDSISMDDFKRFQEDVYYYTISCKRFEDNISSFIKQSPKSDELKKCLKDYCVLTRGESKEEDSIMATSHVKSKLALAKIKSPVLFFMIILLFFLFVFLVFNVCYRNQDDYFSFIINKNLYPTLIKQTSFNSLSFTDLNLIGIKYFLDNDPNLNSSFSLFWRDFYFPTKINEIYNEMANTFENISELFSEMKDNWKYYSELVNTWGIDIVEGSNFTCSSLVIQLSILSKQFSLFSNVSLVLYNDYIKLSTYPIENMYKIFKLFQAFFSNIRTCYPTKLYVKITIQEIVFMLILGLFYFTIFILSKKETLKFWNAFSSLDSKLLDNFLLDIEKKKSSRDEEEMTSDLVLDENEIELENIELFHGKRYEISRTIQPYHKFNYNFILKTLIPLIVIIVLSFLLPICNVYITNNMEVRNYMVYTINSAVSRGIISLTNIFYTIIYPDFNESSKFIISRWLERNSTDDLEFVFQPAEIPKFKSSLVGDLIAEIATIFTQLSYYFKEWSSKGIYNLDENVLNFSYLVYSNLTHYISKTSELMEKNHIYMEQIYQLSNIIQWSLFYFLNVILILLFFSRILFYYDEFRALKAIALVLPSSYFTITSNVIEQFTNQKKKILKEDCPSRFVVKQNPGPICIINHEGIIQEVNPSFLELVNKTKEKVIGENIMKFIDSTDPDPVNFIARLSATWTNFSLKQYNTNSKSLGFTTIPVACYFLPNISNPSLEQENEKKKKKLDVSSSIQEEEEYHNYNQIVPEELHPGHLAPINPKKKHPKKFDDDFLSALIFRDRSLFYEQERKLQSAKKAVEALLFRILPRPMATKLLSKSPVLHSKVDIATIVFLGLDGFTEWTKDHNHKEIMQTLDEIFTSFDILISKFKTLVKIKVINGVYMAAGNLFNEGKNHPYEAVKFSFRCAKQLKKRNDRTHDERLKLVIGVNTGGPIIEGILGQDKPLFDIWGDAVNVAARLETSDPVWHVQISTETKAHLHPNSFHFIQRDGVFLKGKGYCTTFIIPIFEDNESL